METQQHTSDVHRLEIVYVLLCSLKTLPPILSSDYNFFAIIENGLLIGLHSLYWPTLFQRKVNKYATCVKKSCDCKGNEDNIVIVLAHIKTTSNSQHRY